MGMVLSFLANRLEILFFGWSIIFGKIKQEFKIRHKIKSFVSIGLGSSLAFFPSIAVVGQCFKKKRPLANGLVLAGGAIGCTCMPPLLEFLIETYGLNGACLVLAGLVLHYYVCACFLYTIYSTTVLDKQEKPLKLLQISVFKKDVEKDKETEVVNSSDQHKEEAAESILPNEGTAQKRESCLSRFSFVKKSTFIVNCLSNAIHTVLFFGLVTILPDFGEDEIGVSRIEGAYFVSATAIADLVARLVSGYFLIKLDIRKSILTSSVYAVLAVDLVVLAYVRDYYFVMICSAVAGASFACGMILYFEILASCQAPEKYPMAFGISEMIKSPFLLGVASSVGSLKDATGSYTTTFIIFAVIQCLAVALWIFEMIWSRMKTKPVQSDDTQSPEKNILKEQT